MTGIAIEPIPHEPAGEQRSILDAIRADYAAAQTAPQHLDLPIPKSKLGVRYRPLAPEQMPEVDEDQASMRNLDILIAACDCIIVKGPDGWEPFEPDGFPLKLSLDLARVLGFPAETAREAALAAFSTVPAPMYGVARHVTTYSKWVSGESVAREEALLGES